MDIDKKILEVFYYNLQENLETLAFNDAQQLWYDCERVQQPVTKHFDPITLSVFNRMQQETYYKALDTFMAALKLTLFEPDVFDKEEDV